ncbi:MAG: type III-A CRISPR-associated protein Cas10/Csm1, partial [Sphingomonadaceae bacterium]
VGLIPKSHRSQWPLWLDHFDTLWLTVAHAIPSATAFGARPDVSLYDHSKTTAAIATALWRFHRDGDTEAARATMASRADWDEAKFLLIQGDFSGIQSFIFGGDSITQKKAARLLRGRSALVSLLTELAALAVLDELALPPTSQVINAAGRFLIVAPNVAQTREALARVRARLDDWFLERLFGLSGMALAAEPACCNDFVGAERFRSTTARLWQGLERAKRQMFALAARDGPDAVRECAFPAGACAFDPRLPAAPGLQVDAERAHALTAAAVALGKALADPERGRLLIFRAQDAPKLGEMLPLEIFGYRILPTGDREATGNFGAFAESGGLRRAFDIRLPCGDPAEVAWNGYARRALSAFVPTHRHQPDADPRYIRLEAAGRGELKTFEHLARDDQEPRKDGRIEGVEALGILKGDIDDLGAFFAAQGDRPSFARWAEASRRVNAFFTIWLPSRMERDQAFRNVYTVFAGGDDFFFVGPWRTLRKFAWALREDFRAYVAGNAALHFSAGYVMAKPGHPVRQLAREAEAALETAKGFGGGAKNAMTIHGATISWADWGAHVEAMIAAIDARVRDDKLSSGFLYGLLQLAEMAGDRSRPENARWRSRLFYQARRHFERIKAPKEVREQRALALIEAVGVKGLEGSPEAFRVALFDQLYARRD